MREVLSGDAYARTRDYINNNGVRLAPEMAARMFEFYLSGQEPKEIAHINEAIPIEAIWYSMVEGDWVERKKTYVEELHDKTKEKLLYAQTKTADMLSDMLMASVTKNSHKYKQYLVTRDENHLSGAPDIKGLGNLIRIIETINKLTGQDQVRRVKTEETHNINLQAGAEAKSLPSEDAEQILEILAANKRKKEGRE